MSDQDWESLSTSHVLTTRVVMRQSIVGGTFIDTKFYAFSRRAKDRGVVEYPQAVYTNSTILMRSSSYFDKLLSGGFREDKISSLASSFPQDMPDFTNEYEYSSDSDLDDTEIPAERCGSNRSEHGAEDGLEVTQSDPGCQEEKVENVTGPSQTPSHEVKIVGPRGKVVLLPDVAFKTLASDTI
ncbi:hypothetical protein EIP86_000958 [Pleurotus ostreatoroseus]|nr:hypothetical protein EIP86_000958 [Pleurotus ostreatoroseus]